MADPISDKIIALYNKLEAQINTKADASALDGYVAKANLAASLKYDTSDRTISGGYVTLVDRTVNRIVVSSTLSSLTVNFPSAVSGKTRDFFMRIELGSGVSITNLNFPAGVTFENGDGELPEVAEGETTLLYFSETKANTFLLKGEALSTAS